MKAFMRFRNALRTACVCLTLASGLCAATDTASVPRKAYALSTWKNMTCRAKGRFQDREYCASAVMDQIVADGKSAIPVLISQITDSRWIAEPVYDFWPRIRTWELAYFILRDLFVEQLQLLVERLDDVLVHGLSPDASARRWGRAKRPRLRAAKPVARETRAFTGPPYYHTPAKHVTPASNANMTSLAIVII